MRLMNNTNDPSRTNKSSSFVHQRWGNAYGRVWRFSCARYDTQLLRSNITVSREANIHGNYWIDRPIIVVVRPSCSEENITELVFCGGIYNRITVLGLFHYQHMYVIQIGYIPVYPTLWYVHERSDVPECPKQGINQIGNFSKGEIRDAKSGSPDWIIYNDSFEWFCLLFAFSSDELRWL